MAEELYWDPYDYALHADSHPTWGRMREEAPLYRNDEYDFWALTRFDDVLDARVDYQTYSSTQGDILEVVRAGNNEIGDSMISEDPPLHTVHRHLMSRASRRAQSRPSRTGSANSSRVSSTSRWVRVASTSSTTSVPVCPGW